MIKLLVDVSPTKQMLIVVDRSGGYSERNKVLWDERKDGKFPADLVASVGGLVRQNGILVVDAAKLAAYQAAESAKAAAVTQKQNRVEGAKQELNDALLANGDPDLTPLQIRKLFRSIKIILKDVGNQLD